MEICGDNRFEIIARAKAHLLDATNIGTSDDEMKVLDDFLFRCWQMGWLDRYDEPNNSEKPNNCEECEHWNDTEDGCADRHGCKTEPQTYITEDRDTQILDAWQVHRRSTTSVKDEPQTEDTEPISLYDSQRDYDYDLALDQMDCPSK